MSMTETSPELASRTETRMRALSLWQPYASAIALDLKHYETRGYRTLVRGEVAIHATVKLLQPNDIPYLASRSLWDKRSEIPGYASNLSDLFDNLPRMAVVAVAEIADCLPANINHLDLQEVAWGNYSLGRWMWRLLKVRRLKEPVSCKGKQGFFFLPDDVAMKVRAQI